jgi:hypothetical protein
VRIITTFLSSPQSESKIPINFYNANDFLSNKEIKAFIEVLEEKSDTGIPATALNWIVFNKKGKDLRQSATQEQLKELHTVEEKLSFAIDMGYIKTFEQLMSSMRKIWNEKYNPVRHNKKYYHSAC